MCALVPLALKRRLASTSVTREGHPQARTSRRLSTPAPRLRRGTRLSHAMLARNKLIDPMLNFSSFSAVPRQGWLVDSHERQQRKECSLWMITKVPEDAPALDGPEKMMLSRLDPALPHLGRMGAH
jgi:hypothetical protein